MEAYKETAITLYISVKDAAKLAKLPGKLEDYYISVVQAYENKSTTSHNTDETLFKVEFTRSDNHNL